MRKKWTEEQLVCNFMSECVACIHWTVSTCIICSATVQNSLYACELTLDELCLFPESILWEFQTIQVFHRLLARPGEECRSDLVYHKVGASLASYIPEEIRK